MSASSLLLILGLGIGAAIGAAAMLTNFCALGAVADILFARDWRRMRAWILAAGAATFGTAALSAAGLLPPLAQAFPSPLPWLALLIGGLAFGYGMSLSGGCVNRALVRLGAGSLKSLVIVLVVAVVAAMTNRGAIAPIMRILQGVADLPAPATLQDAVDALPGLTGRGWLAGLVVGGGLMAFALLDRWFRTTPLQVGGSLVIGAMVPLAWLVTTHLGEAPAAINFAAPMGDVLGLLTGAATAGFPAAVIIGVPIGAFIAAAGSRNLALETFTDRADLPRNLAGAVLMGCGGTVGLGCTFGQGLSALSATALGAPIAITGILFGCLWGIRSFEAGSVWGGLKLAVGILTRRRLA